MFLGYIVGDKHPCVKTIQLNDLNSLDSFSFYIIVGYSNAISFNQDVRLGEKFIKENVYWIFSKEEQPESYQFELDQALTHAFNFYTKNIQLVRVFSSNQLENVDKGLQIVTKTLGTISNNYIIFYYNPIIQSFLNEPIEEIYSKFSLDHFIAVYKDITGELINIEQVLKLYKTYGNIELYLGWFIMNWLKDKVYDKKNVKLIENIIYCEKMLSNIKLKIDNEFLLEFLYEENPLAELIKENVIEKQFIQQGYKGSDKITGRIFASGSSFSIQTLPALLQPLIIPDEGYLLYEIDYKAFEYNLLAQICNFKATEDPHEELSIFLFNTPDKRQEAKGINYSILYGKNIDTICKEYPADNLKEKLTERLKPLIILEKQLKKEFEEFGYILNYYGRKIYPEKKHALINNYIQSIAADIICNKIIEINSILQIGEKILLQKHDSILFQLNKTNPKFIKQIMEKDVERLNCLVDVTVGTNWGQLKNLII
jgi:hypothetical protein